MGGRTRTPPHRLHSPLDRSRLLTEREELTPERCCLLPRRARVPAGGGARSKNNCFTAMRSGSEEGSYLRLVDFCITQL